MCVVKYFSDNASVQMEQIDERVASMYKQIRTILSRYRSGKLPKAFKIIPSLRNWEQVDLILHFHTFLKRELLTISKGLELHNGNGIAMGLLTTSALAKNTGHISAS